MLSYFSITFIGGEYVYPRYVYYIIPLIYIAVIVVLEAILRGNEQISNVILAAALIFALSNAAFGTLRNGSSYLFQEDRAEMEKLESYCGHKLYVIDDELFSTAVPTGNLTKLELFDNIYMATETDIIGNGMLLDTVQSEGACVVYIATDTYWVNGMDSDEVFGEALRNTGVVYEEIAKGFLGEFYYIYQGYLL